MNALGAPTPTSAIGNLRTLMNQMLSLSALSLRANLKQDEVGDSVPVTVLVLTANLCTFCSNKKRVVL